MRAFLLFITVTVFCSASQLFAKNATAAQYLYMVNQIVPEKQNVAIFMAKDMVETEKVKLERAAATFKLNVTVYVIESARNIGESLKKIDDNTALVVYETPILQEKSSKMFIISKCKEKNIPVITPSEEYVKSGALVGIIVDDKFKMSQLLINLQNYAQFAPKFTEEFTLALGVTEIIK
ncbi:MAG: hypothetical protein H6627_11680 [Calditrichae bacterium]|nr:hypothetical protein [Calditrichota bacterium]MCB9059219.1 hypothetical protein [Calditrichia bacterium]